MDIKLDTASIKELIGESIMVSLNTEKRDALIQGALSYLLTKTTNTYNNRQEDSPLESAFKHALGNIAREIATEALEKDERVRETIRKLIVEAVESLLDDKSYNNLVGKISAAITKGLVRDY